MVQRNPTIAPSQAYPHIEKPDNGSARLKENPRFRVAHLIMAQMAYGWSAEEMCRQYPDLKPAEVYAALTYYCDHRDEIDREIADEWKQSEELRAAAHPSPIFLKLRSKGLL
jgi:uncharacterized protein (DUF433 family)